MAIFAPSISVCTRGSSAGAVASAAYLSRSCLTCERDGLRHDYTRTHEHERLVADLGITAPENVPERLLDRSALWNEVERVERADNAQLARKIMVPLPDELSAEQQIELAREIIGQRCEQGHIVDAAIHVNLPNREHPGEYNSHLHLLEPLREVGPEGFKQKSECVYLVRDVARDRDELMSSAELKAALERGEEWEKVYLYKDGGRTSRLTKEQAEERGLDPIKDRTRKQPVQETRYLNAGWNDRDRAEEWRAQWAEKMNAALERAGFTERVDHRSYERQGIERVPMIHEGYLVQAVERKAERAALEQGREYEPVTEVRRRNIEISRANERIREALAEAWRIAREATQLVTEQVRETMRELERAKERAKEWARNVGRGYEKALSELRREAKRESSFGYVQAAGLATGRDARIASSRERERLERARAQRERAAAISLARASREYEEDREQSQAREHPGHGHSEQSQSAPSQSIGRSR